MPRVTKCELCVRTDTMPLLDRGMAIDRVVVGRRVWLDVTIEFNSGELHLADLSRSHLSEKISKAFENEIQRSVTELVGRGRLVGEER